MNEVVNRRHLYVHGVIMSDDLHSWKREEERSTSEWDRWVCAECGGVSYGYKCQMETVKVTVCHSLTSPDCVYLGCSEYKVWSTLDE